MSGPVLLMHTHAHMHTRTQIILLLFLSWGILSACTKRFAYERHTEGRWLITVNFDWHNRVIDTQLFQSLTEFVTIINRGTTIKIKDRTFSRNDDWRFIWHKGCKSHCPSCLKKHLKNHQHKRSGGRAPWTPYSFGCILSCLHPFCQLYTSAFQFLNFNNLIAMPLINFPNL